MLDSDNAIIRYVQKTQKKEKEIHKFKKNMFKKRRLENSAKWHKLCQTHSFPAT